MTNKQRNEAITAKIERYTQEHTATKDLALEAIQRATMANKTEAMDHLIAQDADLIDGQPTQSDAEIIAENKRLREALKRIQHFSPAYMWRAPDIKVIISAALQEQIK